MKKIKEMGREFGEGSPPPSFGEVETPTVAETPKAKSTPPKGIEAVQIDAVGGFTLRASSASADAAVATIHTMFDQLVAAVRAERIPSGKLTIEVVP